MALPSVCDNERLVDLVRTSCASLAKFLYLLCVWRTLFTPRDVRDRHDRIVEAVHSGNPYALKRRCGVIMKKRDADFSRECVRLFLQKGPECFRLPGNASVLYPEFPDDAVLSLGVGHPVQSLKTVEILSLILVAFYEAGYQVSRPCQYTDAFAVEKEVILFFEFCTQAFAKCRKCFPAGTGIVLFVVEEEDVFGTTRKGVHPVQCTAQDFFIIRRLRGNMGCRRGDRRFFRRRYGSDVFRKR